MLTTHSHLNAEDKYRREVLRDQYQTETKGRVAKTATALVVAGAIALTACGVPAETDAGAAADTQSAILIDNGPTWDPNRAMLEEILSTQGSVDEVLGTQVDEFEFGPMAAPSWQPDTDAVESITGVDTGSVNNTEPFGHPNYGRLSNYLGTESSSGIR